MHKTCYQLITVNKLCGLYSGRGASRYAPTPASGDLKSLREISDWRSPPMSVMRVIVLHQYTKFEIHRPSFSEDMADFRSRPSAAW